MTKHEIIKLECVTPHCQYIIKNTNEEIMMGQEGSGEIGRDTGQNSGKMRDDKVNNADYKTAVCFANSYSSGLWLLFPLPSSPSFHALPKVPDRHFPHSAAMKTI